MNNQVKSSASINDFEILHKIGEGSFSQVYKVKRKSDLKEYALKMVKMGLLKHKERQNALNEIRILASLDNKYIIGYKDAFFDEQGDLLYIIMEYAPGGDVQLMIKEYSQNNRVVEESEIWKALTHISLGLRELHKNGILHRDLKCANIFRCQDGIYKVGDLNVSIVSQGCLAKTQTGTPYYASPEVWREQPYSSSSDIWSVGCIIYEMTALKSPFKAYDLANLFKKVLSGIYDPIPKTYSKELVLMISQLLKVIPNQRPTCQEILKCKSMVERQGDQITEVFKLEQLQQQMILLQTIKLPQNLNMINAKLPPSNYELKGNRQDVQQTHHQQHLQSPDKQHKLKSVRSARPQSLDNKNKSSQKKQPMTPKKQGNTPKKQISTPNKCANKITNQQQSQDPSSQKPPSGKMNQQNKQQQAEFGKNKCVDDINKNANRINKNARIKEPNKIIRQPSAQLLGR